MPKTIYVATPKADKALYGEDYATLSFTKYSGINFDPTRAKITKVFLEGRFSLSNSRTSSVYIATEGNIQLTSTYTLSLDSAAMHFFEEDNNSTAKNIHDPFSLDVDDFSKIINSSNSFSLRLYCNSSKSTYKRITVYQHLFDSTYEDDALNVRHNIWSCHVEWEYIPLKATLPTALGTTNPPNGITENFSGVGSLKLYWSGATGGQNSSGTSLSPKGYKIIQQMDDTNTTVINGNITSASYTLDFPKNSGDTWTYKLYTLSSLGDDYNSSEALTITLTAEFSNPTKPSNFKITNKDKNTIYIGSSASGSNPIILNFTWDKANDGVNNPVTSYTILKDNEYFRTAKPNATSYDITIFSGKGEDYIGVYSLRADCSYGESQTIDDNDKITVKLIPESTLLSPIGPFSVGGKDQVIIEWENNSDKTGVSKIRYTINEKKADGSLTNLTTQSGTSYTYNFSNRDIPEGGTVKIIITPNYIAELGGISSAPALEVTAARKGPLIINSDIWDKNQRYVFYDELKVLWKDILLGDGDSDRGNLSYTLKQSIGEAGSWQTVSSSLSGEGDGTTKFQVEIPVVSIEEGAKVRFLLEVKDGYGIVSQSPVLETRKIITPLITISTTNTDGLQEFTPKFTIKSREDQTKVGYQIYLNYDNYIDIKLKESSGILEFSNNTPNNLDFDLSIITTDSAIDNNDIIESLKDKLQSGYALIDYSYIVKAWYVDSENNAIFTKKDGETDIITILSSATSSAFTIDYTKSSAPYNSGTLNIAGNNEIDRIYNPKDQITLNVDGFSLLDETADSTDFRYAKPIGYQYLINSNYQTSSFASNTITLPNPKDIGTNNVDFFYTVKANYKNNYSNICREYNEEESDLSLFVGNWYKEDIILQNFGKNTIENIEVPYTGIIKLPKSLCSSYKKTETETEIDEETNLSVVKIKASYNDNEYNSHYETLDDEEEDYTEKTGPFSFFQYNKEIIKDWNINGITLHGYNNDDDKYLIVGVDTEDTTFDIQVTLKWINTSNDSFETSTIKLSYREAAADFSIRKQRVGINVDDNFTGISSELNNSAATFEINHGSEMGDRPIVSITNNKVTGYIKTGTEKLILEGFELDTLPIASSSIFGVIKVGSGLNINDDGILSASAQNYALPIATNSTLGGVKIGSGISIDNEGVISVKTQEYQLPTAANGVLGGVTTTSTVTNSQGYIACPIINGVVYSPQINYPVLSVNNKTGTIVLTAQDLSGFSQVAISGSYNDLEDKPTIPTVNYPVTSVNGKTGAVALNNVDVGAAATGHTHGITDLDGVATFRLDGTTLYINTHVVSG